MDAIVVILIFSLLALMIWLRIVFSKRRSIHHQKMEQLKELFSGLVKKQEMLNQKATISSDFQLKYKSDMSKLSEEIFVLQKKIFELISKQ
jgi:hypothetical protein